MNFKKEHSFENRLAESNRVLKKHPDRVPVICERSDLSKIDLDKKKYLVPWDLTMGQFLFIIRKRMELPPEKAIFLFVNGKMVSQSSNVGTVYENEKDKDGFLYLSFSDENVFGR